MEPDDDMETIRSWADVPAWAWAETDEAAAYWDTHEVSELFARPWERAYWRWGNRWLWVGPLVRLWRWRRR